MINEKLTSPRAAGRGRVAPHERGKIDDETLIYEAKKPSRDFTAS